MMSEFLKILSYAESISPAMASKLLSNVELLVPEFTEIKEKIILQFLENMPQDIRANSIKTVKYVRDNTKADLFKAKTLVWDMLGKN